MPVARIFPSLIGALSALGASTAHAQWTVTVLNPAGAPDSVALGVSDGQQVGVTSVNATDHASFWSGSAASWVDLNPAGPGTANGVSGGQQAGFVQVGVQNHASLWSGTAASWVDLHPAGTLNSYANSVSGGNQVGYAIVGINEHASLWSGTAASWVDLNPAGAVGSSAKGVAGGLQVGYTIVGGRQHASLWNGTAASWVDLHPAGATVSLAGGVSEDQQVGRAIVDTGDTHAGLWIGTAASWVDLNPPGASDSDAIGVYRGQQVGNAIVGGRPRASLWNGTAASWVDLHSFLPPDLSSIGSEARGIWHDDSSTYVVGYANATTGQLRAVMWSAPSPGCDTAITDQPQPVALVPDSTAVFTIGVSGTVTGYQWRRGNSPLSNGGRIDGANSAMLTITNVQSADQGNYNCVVTGLCTLYSRAAELSCRPIITTQPPSTEILRVGLQISVGVPNSVPYSYRWRQEGQNLFNIPELIGGVTTRTLTLLAVDPSLAGTYDCVLTDSCGTTQSTSTEVYCPTDFDQDGFITGLDFDLFVAAFEAGEETADFDSDGFITGLDFDAFVGAFEAGC